MRILFTSILMLTFLAFFAPVSAYAAYYVLEPSEGAFQPNSVVTVLIKAGPDFTRNDASGMQLKLLMEGEGSSIVSESWTPPTGSNYITAGMCTTNAEEITRSKVCVDYGSRGERLVTEGDILGTFRVKLGSSEGVTEIVLDEDNEIAFVENGVQAIEAGDVLAEYTVSEDVTPTPTSTPNTSIDSSSLGAIMGFLVVTLGAGFYIWRSKTASI